MLPSIHRIQNSGQGSSKQPVGLAREWCFSDWVAAQNEAFYREFVTSHTLLRFEYRVVCSKLASAMRQDGPKRKQKLETLAMEALAMSEILQEIYQNYLNSPVSAQELKRDAEIFRTYLKSQGIKFFEDPSLEKKQFLYDERPIHAITGNLSFLRLLSSRSRNFILSLRPLFTESAPFNQALKVVDPYLGIFFFICCVD